MSDANQNFGEIPKLGRPTKSDTYLKMALILSEQSTCMRTGYGALIVRDDTILSAGYNGMARGEPHCIDVEICGREGVASRTRYELCKSIHSESNACLNARCDLRGSDIYIAGHDKKTLEEKLGDRCLPCSMCLRILIQCGIIGVWIRDEFGLPEYLTIKAVKEIVEV
jgi:dCMP deaminase